MKRKTSYSRNVSRRIQEKMPTLPEGWESQFVRSEREDTIATVVMLILVGLAILAVVIK